MPIQRVVMFKLPKDEDVEKTLAQYSTLQAKATKDGKPYILDVKAYKLYNDPRSQGFTACGSTTFTSLEDMKYYDTECEAHGALKAVVGPLAQGLMMIYYDV